MKRLLFLLLILIPLVFFSCNSGQFSGDQGSVSFDVSKAEDYICRNVSQNITLLKSYNSTYDEREFVSYTIKVKVSTEGDYEDGVENEYSKKLNEILNAAAPDQAILNFVKDSLANRITLKGIPVGSNIKVKLLITSAITLDEQAFKQKLAAASVSQAFIDSLVSSVLQEMNAQTQTWNGESASFTVKNGVNKVNIRVKGLKFADYEYEEEDDGIKIFLYSNNIIDIPGQEPVLNSGIFSFPSSLITSKRILTPEIFTTEKGFDDFAIDEDNNVYYVVKGNFDEDLRKTPAWFYKNGEIIHSASIGEQDEAFYFAVEPRTGLLFYVLKNMGSSMSINAYDTRSNQNISQIDSFIDSNFLYDFTIAFDEPTQTPDGLLYEGASYASVDDSDFTFIKRPIQYIVSGDERRITSAGQDETITLRSGSPGFWDSLSEEDRDAKITDMMVQGNKLYILLREVTDFDKKGLSKNVTFTEDKANPVEMELRSRGALITIDTENFDSLSALSDNSIMTSEDISIPYDFINPYTNSNDQGIVDFTIYQPLKNSAFLGPEKFISIRPDKLVIADDGYYFYKNNQNELHIKNINRVVTVEIDKVPQTTTSIEIQTSIPITFYDELYSDLFVECNINNDTVRVPCIVEQ